MKQEEGAAFLRGAEGGIGQFVATLHELKHAGCALLVVGDVDLAARQLHSRHMMGSALHPRQRVIGVTPDAGEPDAYLPADHEVEADPENVDSYCIHAEGLGRAAADTSAPPEPSVLPSAPPAGTDAPDEVAPAVFRARLVETIVRIDRSNDLAPGQLRVGVATLSPLIEVAGIDAARDLVALVGGLTADAHGMAHFHVPAGKDSAIVAALEDTVDACVELRRQRGRVEHRWHLPTAGESAWLPYDAAGGDA